VSIAILAKDGRQHGLGTLIYGIITFVINKRFMMSEQVLSSYLSKPVVLQQISYDNQLCWLKKAKPAHPAYLYALLNFCARVLGAPLLRAVPKKGGSFAIQQEVTRLKALKNQGVNVPSIIKSHSDYLVMSHLGDNFQQALESSRGKVRLGLFKKALDALKSIHDSNAYLSQAFCRNMVIDAHDKLGFIDFEDDPLDSLTLDQAKARDIVLFLLSTVYLFRDQRDDLITILKQVFLHTDDVITAAIFKTVKSLAVLRYIPSWRCLGREFPRLKFTLSILSQCLVS